MSPESRQALLRILVLVFVVGLSVTIYLFREQAAQLANYGYAGIFLLSVLANATLILPAPGVAVVFVMGGVFNPLGVALAAGSGSAIGELSGYLAGFSGQIVLENTRLYQHIVGWMAKHRPFAFLMIFLLAAVPNPFFDLAGIAAGALRFSILHFLFWAWLGKLVKMLFFAFAGYYSLGWLSAH